MRNIYSIYKEHYKALISLGLPIVIGQIGVIVLGFADTLMIGHHSNRSVTVNKNALSQNLIQRTA